MIATSSPTASSISASTNRCRCRGGVPSIPESRHRPGSAQKYGLTDSERVQRGCQFADAVAAQLVGLVDSKVRISLTDDFAFFAEGAGDNVHVSAVRDVMRNGSAGCQRFVVRMGVDEQQTRCFL